MNTDIVTSKVSEINITYEKGGNEAKSYMVAEQLITKWNPDKKKFETVIYDKFLWFCIVLFILILLLMFIEVPHLLIYTQAIFL